MSETTCYVIYFIAEQRFNLSNINPNNNPINNTSSNSFDLKLEDNLKTLINPENIQAVTNFLINRNSSPEYATVIASFVEKVDKINSKANKWQQLSDASNFCKANNAELIIAELGALTENERFCQILLESGLNFHCCDQLFVTQTILNALYQHSQVKKKRHGQLIKKGLNATTKNSGNPRAGELIEKVNQPKIDAAIVFALLLDPIVQDYIEKNFSQRQMVKTLNDEGFTAPEGGKWVLSQLQKVLDRVKLNNLSINNASLLAELQKDNLSNQEIAEALTLKGIKATKKSGWNETQVEKLNARTEQIKDIQIINNIIAKLIPIIQTCREMELSSIETIDALEKAGLNVLSGNYDSTASELNTVEIQDEALI